MWKRNIPWIFANAFLSSQCGTALHTARFHLPNPHAPGVRSHPDASSVGAWAHLKAPSKGAAERLMALESASQRDVQNRGLRADQEGGCAIDTQSQGEVLGGLSKNCTECPMSMKHGLTRLGSQVREEYVFAGISFRVIKRSLELFPVRHWVCGLCRQLLPPVLQVCSGRR